MGGLDQQHDGVRKKCDLFEILDEFRTISREAIDDFFRQRSLR